METFTAPWALVDNPLYRDQRRKSQRHLATAEIDTPIADIVHRFNKLTFCFTLQSCYGHFAPIGQKDSQSLAQLPDIGPDEPLTYRIAYIALCLENNSAGRKLLADLAAVAAIDPAHVQFGCADWFWQRQVNSYALQVMPVRFQYQDCARLDLKEAWHVEKIRNRFFVRLDECLEKPWAQ